MNTFNAKIGEAPCEVTDAEIAHLTALSDTASSAAIAYACKTEGTPPAHAAEQVKALLVADFLAHLVFAFLPSLERSPLAWGKCLML